MIDYIYTFINFCADYNAYDWVKFIWFSTGFAILIRICIRTERNEEEIARRVRLQVKEIITRAMIIKSAGGRHQEERELKKRQELEIMTNPNSSLKDDPIQEEEKKKQQQQAEDLYAEMLECERELLTKLNESIEEAMKSDDAVSDSQWLEQAKEQVEAQERESKAHQLN